MAIKDQKIEKFLEELSGKGATPGGGAAAALCGAMAASLVEMVINLTKSQELKGKDLNKIKKLRVDLLKLADEDVAAFNAVMVAYKSKSKPRIKKALEYATEVPQKTKTLAKEVENLSRKAVKYGNKNALSDAKTALLFSRAAQASAEENIRINKLALKKL
jgi:formiminotetrahydrofolate cyclodeaminase